MLKTLSDFIMTGVAVIIVYLTYFVIATIATLMIGFPIAIGIKMILDIISVIFTHSGTLPY